MKFWRRIPMRYKMIIGLALLVGILFLWGRNLQAQVHVSDKKYDIMLSTLLSPGVPAVSVDSIEHGKYLLLDAREKREFEVSHIENAMWVGYDDFDLKRVAGISKEEYLQLKSEFYDEDGYLVNTMLGKEVKMIGGRLLPARLEMIPADEEGKMTVVEQLDIIFDKPIDDSFFSIQNMKRVR